MVYVKRRQDAGFVARSAYKLLQLADKYVLFSPHCTVIDLGAAPGGWCQAVQARCKTARLYALDLLPLQAPLPGVAFVQGDFTDASDRARLAALLATDGGVPRADVILCDMMANTSGNAVRDAQASLDLCEAAWDFAYSMLRPPSGAARGGTFLCKFFMSSEADTFRKHVLSKHFASVRAEKMDASRAGSREQYWVCQGFKGAADE
ncbi:methylene-fatty-acyl-phospholipid synthase [Malassezia sp. CBS 17886]|nr:methylene-fatty-acyl-phospholipid synthase [Malassezia sp. CBS 17886]